MVFKKTDLEGLVEITLKKYSDERGFFMERYKRSQFFDNGINASFLQINHSRSKAKVLRGLHYQYDEPQGKLVGCLAGSIWDVAVDIRPNSPTYAHHFSIELSAENGKLLWVPAGFAHGFCTLGSDPADVVYMVDAEYNGKTEKSISWSDPEFNISWPIENPLLSEKDKVAPSFKEYDDSDLAKDQWWSK